MADQLQLEIVTPARRVVSEACSEVLLPAQKGEVGILPGHAAYVSTLTTGRVRYVGEGKVNWVAVQGGFLQVIDNKVTVLADQAVLSSEIDKAQVTKARAELEQKLLSAEVSLEDREKLFAERDWLEAKALA